MKIFLLLGISNLNFYFVILYSISLFLVKESKNSNNLGNKILTLLYKIKS